MNDLELKYLELFDSLKEIESVLGFDFDTMSQGVIKKAIELAREEVKKKIYNNSY